MKIKVIESDLERLGNEIITYILWQSVMVVTE